MQDARHKTFWIPQRCEINGCTNREEAKKCSQCDMVMYCSTCGSLCCVMADQPVHAPTAQSRTTNRLFM